ncbi:MAG: hypothetical protein CMK02_05345 [Polycyclovorans sp.]|nr:hypothetical protein [Polycyclovorans sp.]|tara:strand:- start:8869 stop:10191 length:1323 start_codon:yes stop_codon:yes gene_type:complete
MRVLEVNDAGLRLCDGAQVLATEPGFASVSGDQIIVGERARQLARRSPQLSHSRFWYQLDQTPLERPLSRVRHTADLAYWHLRQLREAAEGQPLMLAVPSSFEADQLGLLLGLCRAAELGAVGLVDAAVAAVAAGAPASAPGVVLHVDVQLHRVWLTRLAVDAAVVRGAGHDLAKPGLVSVWDAAATVIAEAFVRQTRVDPLHSAASEQALYDALPDWLAQLSRSPVASLALTVGGRSHRISLARDAVVVALNPLLTRITQALRADVAAAPDAQVMLSDRAAAIPGLIEALTTALGTAPQVLTPLAAAQGALRHRALIQTGAEALPWVTRLPAAARAAPEAPEAPETTAPVAPPAAPVQAALPPPTHLLLGDEATALVSDRVAEAWGLRVMVREDGAVGLRADSAVQLNGAPLVADTALKAGDWLQVQDRVLRVIRVRDS